MNSRAWDSNGCWEWRGSNARIEYQSDGVGVTFSRSFESRRQFLWSLFTKHVGEIVFYAWRKGTCYKSWKVREIEMVKWMFEVYAAGTRDGGCADIRQRSFLTDGGCRTIPSRFLKRSWALWARIFVHTFWDPKMSFSLEGWIFFDCGQDAKNSKVFMTKLGLLIVFKHVIIRQKTAEILSRGRIFKSTVQLERTRWPWVELA